MKITVSKNAFGFKVAILKKNIIIRLFMLSLAYMFFSLSIVYANNMIKWYEWWSNERTPLKVIGYLKKIKELHGRNSRYQYVYVNTNKGVVCLDSALSKNKIKSISSIVSKLVFEYYPTSTGESWIFRISSNRSKTIFYEGLYHDDGWQSFFGIFAFIGYFMLSIPLFIFSFRDFSVPFRISIT